MKVYSQGLALNFRYMSGSSSIFDPHTECARNKHYKLWCHHMELGELSDVIWYFRSKNGYAIWCSARAMRTCTLWRQHIELGVSLTLKAFSKIIIWKGLGTRLYRTYLQIHSGKVFFRVDISPRTVYIPPAANKQAETFATWAPR